MICFTSLSQIFVLTYSSSLAIARLHSYVKFAEPQNWASSPTSSLIKKYLDIKSNSYLFVDGGTWTPTGYPTRPSNVRVYHSATSTHSIFNFQTIFYKKMCRSNRSSWAFALSQKDNQSFCSAECHIDTLCSCEIKDFYVAIGQLQPLAQRKLLGSLGLHMLLWNQRFLRRHRSA